jgi:hypothetical protein
MHGFKIAAVAAMVVLMLAGGGALVLWLDGGPLIRWALQNPISAVIARQIRIDGRLDVRWGVPTHISAENVHIANTSWGSTFFITLSPHNKNFTLVALRVPVDLHGTFSQPLYNFRRGDMVRRLGEALGLALVPLVDVGLGEDNQCSKALSAQLNPGSGKPPKPTTDKRQ